MDLRGCCQYRQNQVLPGGHAFVFPCGLGDYHTEAILLYTRSFRFFWTLLASETENSNLHEKQFSVHLLHGDLLSSPHPQPKSRHTRCLPPFLCGRFTSYVSSTKHKLALGGTTYYNESPVTVTLGVFCFMMIYKLMEYLDIDGILDLVKSRGCMILGRSPESCVRNSISSSASDARLGEDDNTKSIICV